MRALCLRLAASTSDYGMLCRCTYNTQAYDGREIEKIIKFIKMANGFRFVNQDKMRSAEGISKIIIIINTFISDIFVKISTFWLVFKIYAEPVTIQLLRGHDMVRWVIVTFTFHFIRFVCFCFTLLYLCVFCDNEHMSSFFFLNIQVHSRKIEFHVDGNYLKYKKTTNQRFLYQLTASEWKYSIAQVFYFLCAFFVFKVRF